MANYRDIFRSTSLLGGVQALYILLSIVRNKITAILIGAVGMGLAELYFRTIQTIGNATNFGLQTSAVKHLSVIYREEEARSNLTSRRMHAQVRLIRTLVSLTALLGFILTAGLSPFISLIATGDYKDTPTFLLLAPAVAFTTLSGGETAILKASRRLKRIAKATILTAFGGVITSAVCYAIAGIAGIIPSLLLMSFTMWYFSFNAVKRDFPFSLNLHYRSIIRHGRPMVKLGIAYVLSGLALSGMELLIRAYLGSTTGGLALVGLYSAGFTLTVSYERLLFVSMDGDFLPRLAACGENQREMNVAVNRQINTLAVFATPALIVFSLFLPLIIRLLYTVEFLQMESMVRMTVYCMFFKAVYAPLAYLPLARGDGRIFVWTELFSDLLILGCVISGYHLAGLTGTGVGLSVAHALHILLYVVVYHHQYGVRLKTGTTQRVSLLFILLIIGLSSAQLSTPIFRLLGHLTALLLTLPIILPIVKKVRK